MLLSVNYGKISKASPYISTHTLSYPDQIAAEYDTSDGVSDRGLLARDRGRTLETGLKRVAFLSLRVMNI